VFGNFWLTFSNPWKKLRFGSLGFSNHWKNGQESFQPLEKILPSIGKSLVGRTFISGQMDGGLLFSIPATEVRMLFLFASDFSIKKERA